ncbi:MAG: PQQ-binding-like beta-propeller repeat protein [Planctomycetota bacterium]
MRVLPSRVLPCLFAIAFGILTPHLNAQNGNVSNQKTGVPKVATWMNFRGSTSGVTSARLPSRFQADNVAWKSALPGRGASTPIVVGNKIITTAFSGFGESAENPGTLDALRHHVLCFDADTGKLLWQRNIKGNIAVNKRVSENLRGHGFASSTPASDGESIFVFFGVSGVFAFDLDGEFLWQNDVGWKDDNFGSSSSLTVYGNKLIVNASIESDSVYAFDTKSGRGIWKIDDVFRSWSTPVVGRSQAGRQELVIVQKDIVRGFDPETGVELWTCEGIHDYIVPSPVFDQGIVYLNGGKQSRTVAIKLGGLGDVTETHRLWEARYGANVGSSIVFNGLVFNTLENGIVQCYDAKSGKVLKRERIKGAGVVYGSPTIVPGVGQQSAQLLVPLTGNGVAVLEANANLKFVGYNVFASDPSDVKASLTVSGERFITRSEKYLYCIARPKTKTVTHELDTDATQVDVASADKYDFDAKTGRVRVYNRALEFDPEKLVTFILYSYNSVLTETQKVKFREYVLENTDAFLNLRKRRAEIHWQHLTQVPKLRSTEALAKSLGTLETETMATQRDIRNVIKKQFTPEQLAEHLGESKAAKR